MDQLKEYFAVAVKYGFWIGCGTVFLLSLVFWYLSTSTLATEAEKQTSSIKASISTVSQIQSELSMHPNAQSHAEMQKLIEDRQNQVLESWETLFERQSEILVWPEDVLTKKFVDQYRNKIPIEYYVEYPTPEADSLTTSMRSTYAKHIKNELPDLAEIAGAEWTANFDTSSNNAGMMGGGMGVARRNIDPNLREEAILGLRQGPLVVWTQQSQANLLTDLFPWRQAGLPNTLEIYYSQENLWVLRQLLEIIGKVNGPAKQPYQAKIHEINGIKIGSSVVFGAGQISAPGSSRVSTGMGMGMGMSDMGMDDMGMDDFGMGMGMGEEDESPDPAEFRYVSESLEKIAAVDLRSALKDIKPQNVALAIAKRLPVMMSLKMNQRAIPELLAACGSAKLMVKVRQTRIMPKGKVSTASSGGGGGGGMGMDMGMDDLEMEDGMGMGMGMGGSSMGRGMTGNDQPIDEFPLDMQVEIYGLIYIYNPPDLDKLAIEQINEETVEQAVQDLSGEVKEPVQPAAPAVDPPAAGGDDAVLPTPDPATVPATPPAPGGQPAEVPADPASVPTEAPAPAAPVTSLPPSNLTPTG
ncbi:hypothetical protein LF1_41870 [Rubripirellula obstinata]|uniref:Uncharacterized protein n=1 Tax=Rubripirellula obstinata TaxID=406547 RepID=A0A5B1CMQ2_9BACT|nr:hypothetical protein [Rubripirellula obstinata]KAA1261632.1 hypothetical protein LF1_41870 [Rubripirellula obstinata]